MNISIIGSGYVGLITGAGLAKLGHKVICVDVMKEKVDMINAAEPPIYEDDLPELMKEVIPKRLSATTDARKAILDTELTFIGVGTPPTEGGSPNLTYLKQAAETIGKALKEK
ncbi:MAG: UDP-glucose/GDP-mannose dehydrogenase family protein, partial [Candidatus Aenigmarchaeota archaeon]|nr:UDP-glucose/GDP-mannose dehydrogenase family protein [Candidatus Aenigmarchaeota archaeon]